MQQDRVAGIRCHISGMQELLIAFFIGFHPLNGTYREAISHRNNRQLILTRTLSVNRDGCTCSTLIERVLESSLQLIRKFLQILIIIGRRDRHQYRFFIDAGRIGRTQIPFVVTQMQLYLIVVKPQIHSTLTYNLRSEELDVIIRLQFLLQLCQDIQAQHLPVAIRFFIVFSLHDLGQFNIESILDVIDADFIGQISKVDKFSLWKNRITQLSGDIRHIQFIRPEVRFKFAHRIVLTNLDDGSLHVFQPLVHFPLGCNQSFSFLYGIIDLLTERRDIRIHLTQLHSEFRGQFLGEFPGQKHCFRSIVISQDILMVGIQACSLTYHTLQNTQLAPVFYRSYTVLIANFIVVFLIIGLLVQICPDLSHTFQQQLRNLLQLDDRHITDFPFFKQFRFYLMANFSGHLRDRPFFSLEESFDTFFTEMLQIKFAHDIVQLVQRTIGFLRLFRIADGFVMPIFIETGIIRIRFQDLHIQCQMRIVQHPIGKIVLVQIFLPIVLVLFFIDKSLVFTPVIVFELIQNTFSYRIGNMFQDTKLRIHHAFDTKRIYFFGSCHRNPSVASGIGRFVIFQSKIIHVLKIISSDDIIVDLVFIIHEEYAGKNIIAYDLWQFRQRINR